jgi:hypothetical protein
MQFKLKKELIVGRYFVQVELTEYDELDKAKAAKFGIPSIMVKVKNGSNIPARITQLEIYDPFGFYNQEEADQYVDNLKTQITTLKQKWNSLEDSWSNEEVL